ncbi:MAG TPA: DinB family protein [Gemmataceae bacterium]|nr:DinB family protein [Gemmataceae bacterium]
MSVADLRAYLELSRKKTNELIDAVARLPNPAEALAFRPAPGRAHLAWQLMHIGATDDRHLYTRMRPGQAKEPEYVRRFAFGSVPDEDIPTLEEIRRYLNERRQDLLAHLNSLKDEDLPRKPHDQAPYTYQEWVPVLALHEGHHHGQAHLTLNLYKASKGLIDKKG